MRAQSRTRSSVAAARAGGERARGDARQYRGRVSRRRPVDRRDHAAEQQEPDHAAGARWSAELGLKPGDEIDLLVLGDDDLILSGGRRRRRNGSRSICRERCMCPDGSTKERIDAYVRGERDSWTRDRRRFLEAIDRVRTAWRSIRALASTTSSGEHRVLELLVLLVRSRDRRGTAIVLVRDRAARVAGTAVSGRGSASAAADLSLRRGTRA